MRVLPSVHLCTVTDFVERDLRGSRSCVSGDHATGKRDDVPRGGHGPDGDLHAGAPDQKRAQPQQGEEEEGHTKYGQRSQKLAHIIRVQTEPQGRYDQSARVVSNFDFTQ